MHRNWLQSRGAGQAWMLGLGGRWLQSLRRVRLGLRPTARQGAERRAQACYKAGGKDCIIRTFLCDAKG
jgi:hypothetical protein